MGLITKIFGTHSQHELKRIEPLAGRVEALEPEFQKLTDAELRDKTAEFKERYKDGETLDDLLPEAFAAVREASVRVLGMRHYHVQLVGGIVLHQGRIAEMKTGEGKTLVATLPAYLNALTGEGVHIVTVNDYLAKRDSEWMGKVYRFLGLKVGLIVHGLTSAERHDAYSADITYGTNNEMGFDYLRDNMAIYKSEMVQRGHVFAIVDEVDSILIDEARTPLIISGQGEASTQLYKLADDFARGLTRLTIASTDEKAEEDVNIDADYIVDEKARSVTLTARGVKKAEQHFSLENLSDVENSTLSHHINQAIRARGIMKRDVDYVVRDGEVIIVDEFTGRLMFGRRYSEGLHQAIEAKEGVEVEHESKTLATITFQNYFRLYRKLSGMTGTALTEAEEFSEIYKLDIIEIPTNKPMIRADYPDAVYKTDAGKLRAIMRQIKECHDRGQPVLVGTISIEKSEVLSKLLLRDGIKHNVLNAKHHEREAEIIAQAGKFGAVTIATNMAGRGTDIMLGGNPEYMAKSDMRRQGFTDEQLAEATGFAETDDEDILNARRVFSELNEKYKEEIKREAEDVRNAGGLFIVGTERHDARRIDNQLRGRSGRQGDRGESRFYIAMTDDIMRLFGSERIMGMMDSLGIDEDTPIDQKVLSNAIESAQGRVESRNFQTRKNVLEYDDVMNKQREIIYGQRQKVLDGEDLQGFIHSMTEDVIERGVKTVLGERRHLESPEQLQEVARPFEQLFLPPGSLKYQENELNRLTADDIADALKERAFAFYAAKEKALGSPLMRELERVIMLRVVDEYWMEHIDMMQELRKGITLRAYAQTDPVVEYKREGFAMFDEMIAAIREETVRRVFVARVKSQEQVRREKVAKNITEGGGDGTVKRQPVKKAQKIGRNDPCPCGKMKADGSRRLKYKECCGRNES